MTVKLNNVSIKHQQDSLETELAYMISRLHKIMYNNKEVIHEIMCPVTTESGDNIIVVWLLCIYMLETDIIELLSRCHLKIAYQPILNSIDILLSEN